MGIGGQVKNRRQWALDRTGGQISRAETKSVRRSTSPTAPRPDAIQRVYGGCVWEEFHSTCDKETPNGSLLNQLAQYLRRRQARIP
jgi:hypothetical protein